MKRKSLFLVTVFALFAFVLTANVGSAKSDFAPGATLESFTLPDLDGNQQSFDKLKGKNGAVLVWLSAQCPVVKQYNERINQVAAELKAKGINVIGINSNATESLDWVKSDAAEVGYKFPVLIDKGNVLADKLGASVTPEVYYFNEKNVLLYQGAIDNDRSGKNIKTFYLRDAADAALAGKEITTKKANAFGCTIKRAEKSAAVK
jgi:peroxiredoxin